MKKKLNQYSLEERLNLAIELIEEQIIEQRNQLHKWRDLTNQPAQIDTGYIGQHLVSLITGIEGGGFRGKGDDLSDGSEIKSANFLDSLDANGATAPRWNFTCNDEAQMEAFLNYPTIYLVSVDLTPSDNPRFRVWQVSPAAHTDLADRYREWMRILGYPKLRGEDRAAVNFQLFPPKSKHNDSYARHGNGRSNGFSKIQIELDNHAGSKKLFHAEIVGTKVKIITN